MREADYQAFTAMLDDVYGLKGQALTAGQKAMFFRALQSHPLQEVRAGLDAHVKDPSRGRFLPMPADVVAQITGLAAADGRPEADEAWAIAVRAADEAVTVVWTPEIAEAWAVCRPVHDGGDEVGARMAFKAAYGRMLEAARERREPAQWLASIGHDPDQRDVVLSVAVERGQLSQAYLPSPKSPAAGLLELSQARGCPPAIAAQLLAIRGEILARGEGGGIDGAEKRRTAEAKAQSAEAVARYTGDGKVEAA